MGQYNGKWPLSLFYVLKPLITGVCLINRHHDFYSNSKSWIYSYCGSGTVFSDLCSLILLPRGRRSVDLLLGIVGRFITTNFFYPYILEFFYTVRESWNCGGFVYRLAHEWVVVSGALFSGHGDSNAYFNPPQKKMVFLIHQIGWFCGYNFISWQIIWSARVCGWAQL